MLRSATNSGGFSYGTNGAIYLKKELTELLSWPEVVEWTGLTSKNMVLK